MHPTQKFTTHSPAETQEVGEKIGRSLKPGDVVALIGALGAGKTCLTQGIARGAGVHCEQTVNSPSYVLINEYAGRLPIYHIDLYRLQHLGEIVDLGLEEYLDGDGVCVIEWADRMESLLPGRHIRIHITGKDEFTRTIQITSQSVGYGTSGEDR